MRVLDTGVRVLPRADWYERERQLHHDVHGTPIHVDGDTLVLPHLRGTTLAALLEDAAVNEPARKRAIGLAVAALARFHRLGFTHGDAMAENVMVDVESGSAHWFDFETAHDARRSATWQRADDVRALLTTCTLRIPSAQRADAIRLILDAYGDDEVCAAVRACFTPRVQRTLVFHLGQAGLSLRCYRDIAHQIGELRRGDVGLTTGQGPPAATSH